MLITEYDTFQFGTGDSSIHTRPLNKRRVSYAYVSLDSQRSDAAMLLADWLQDLW